VLHHLQAEQGLRLAQRGLNACTCVAAGESEAEITITFWERRHPFPDRNCAGHSRDARDGGGAINPMGGSDTPPRRTRSRPGLPEVSTTG
jgi:hypothetical protein